jgi:ABC-type bacteriocin/lantibiotic exporter with double-glycine peptidase domain
MLSGIKTLISFNLEDYATETYSSAVRKTQNLGITNDILKGAMLGIVYASWMSAMGLGWYFGSTPVHQGQISFAYLATFIGLISQVLQGIMGIFGVLPALAAAIGAATKLLEPMLLWPSVKDKKSLGRRPSAALGDLAFENVRFAYPTKLDLAVFENMNLRIPRGRSIAVVGTSGSGKSTLLQLVERFYDPLAGRVTLDGGETRPSFFWSRDLRLEL